MSVLADITLRVTGHRDHDVHWCLPSHTNPDEPTVCFACLVELLANPDSLHVRKKFILAEFLQLTSYQGNHVKALLTSDPRVGVYTAGILLGLSGLYTL